MTTTDLLQLLGTASVAALGLLFYYISTKPSEWFDRYGREALLLAASYQATVVVVRMMVIFDGVSQTDARTMNGLVAFGFAGVLVQIASAHREAVRTAQGEERT